MVGDGRSLDGVVGAGRPTGRPILLRPVPPPTAAALAFRGDRRYGGDKLRGGGIRRRKDQRLVRWSLPERISYFQLPDRPFRQPLPIVGSLLLSFLFFSQRGTASTSSLYLCFLFSPPQSRDSRPVAPLPARIARHANSNPSIACWRSSVAFVASAVTIFGRSIVENDVRSSTRRVLPLREFTSPFWKRSLPHHRTRRYPPSFFFFFFFA